MSLYLRWILVLVASPVPRVRRAGAVTNRGSGQSVLQKIGAANFWNDIRSEFQFRFSRVKRYGKSRLKVRSLLYIRVVYSSCLKSKKIVTEDSSTMSKLLHVKVTWELYILTCIFKLAYFLPQTTWKYHFGNVNWNQFGAGGIYFWVFESDESWLLSHVEYRLAISWIKYF